MSLAIRPGTLASRGSVFIGLDGDQEAIAESAEVVYQAVDPMICVASASRNLPEMSLGSNVFRRAANVRDS